MAVLGGPQTHSDSFCFNPKRHIDPNGHVFVSLRSFFDVNVPLNYLSVCSLWLLLMLSEGINQKSGAHTHTHRTDRGIYHGEYCLPRWPPGPAIFTCLRFAIQQLSLLVGMKQTHITGRKKYLRCFFIEIFKEDPHVRSLDYMKMIHCCLYKCIKFIIVLT